MTQADIVIHRRKIPSLATKMFQRPPGAWMIHFNLPEGTC